jgi:hypothetical protein
MGLIKSYTEFVNENLAGQYSYYGAGSLFPIVSKLASEGKSPQQIYLYLTSLGVDEERKVRVISKMFLKESVDFDELKTLSENILFEEDDILNADISDLKKGIEPEKAKPDTEIKAALDKLKDGGSEEDEDKPSTDDSTKIQALQSALKDAQKIEKIKKILAESLNFNIDRVEDSVLVGVLDYHRILENMSDAQVNNLTDRDFVFPEKRSWPIHTEKAAKTALVWSNWGKYRDIKNRIVESVTRRYPHLKDFN